MGVQRQYTGTAGRIENSQVAVYLSYAAAAGHAFIHRALYLPASWAADPVRRDQAHVPDQVRLATKPSLAAQMITRAVTAKVPASWVAGDEVYGTDPGLRATIRRHSLGYVMQIAANRQVPTATGPIRIDQFTTGLPARVWQKHSAGAGSKGHRYYSWAWAEISPEPATRSPDPITPDSDRDATPAGRHYVLIRRHDTTGRACLPPLLRTPTSEPDHPDHGGQATLADRGILPSRQRPDQPRPAPGPDLDLLASLDHPGIAGPPWPCSPTRS